MLLAHSVTLRDGLSAEQAVAGSGPTNASSAPIPASLSALSFPGMPVCPGTQVRHTFVCLESSFRIFLHSQTILEFMTQAERAFSAAWLSDMIVVSVLKVPDSSRE